MLKAKRFAMAIRPALTVIALGAAVAVRAQAPADPSGIDQEVLVTGGRDDIITTAGSATFIDEQMIEQFEVTDVNALLARVPGVYIRQEDGFGLRPNIGLRGTNSDRSSKITIMEDGILIGPAPYSAPAAYYVPNVNRMAAVEVFKGPAVVRYGPHTVGGAINFVTQAIPDAQTGELEATAGSYGYRKYLARYGEDLRRFGYAVEGLHYGSDGFKELDGGGDTGFTRNDFNTKLQWRSSAAAPVYQEVELKLGYADEESHETYLGLTDEDFAERPNRRYRASALDRFVSEHSQIHLLHTADFRNNWKLVSRLYHNRFERAWNKFDGLIASPYVDAADVLNGNLLSGFDELQLIRGERDSDVSNPEGERIDVTNNDREFASQGAQVEFHHRRDWGAAAHRLIGGIRYHNDWVERDHSQRGYFMQDGELIFDGESRPDKALNRAEVDAVALFIQDEIAWGDWVANAGLRYEHIESDFVEQAPGRATDRTGSQEQLMPGAGLFYHLSDAFGVLVGVSKGFSPKAPSASAQVEPEESVNYEYGFRYVGSGLYGEAIGFYSDYSNLLGRCRASEDCAGEEFNGGAAEIQGVELSLDLSLSLAPGWEVPVSGVYTYTDARFETAFVSDFSQWGIIDAGDRLPYVPRHQAHVQVGLNHRDVSLALAVKHVDEMVEAAGSGVPLSGETSDALTTANLSLDYRWDRHWSLRLVAQNVTDEQVIVARRPYGARPNHPRLLKAGVTYRF